MDNAIDTFAGIFGTAFGWLVMMLFGLPFAFLWMNAWNSSLSDIFGWTHITYWQAYWLSVIVGIMPTRISVSRHS